MDNEDDNLIPKIDTLHVPLLSLQQQPPPTLQTFPQHSLVYNQPPQHQPYDHHQHDEVEQIQQQQHCQQHAPQLQQHQHQHQTRNSEQEEEEEEERRQLHHRHHHHQQQQQNLQQLQQQQEHLQQHHQQEQHHQHQQHHQQHQHLLQQQEDQQQQQQQDQMLLQPSAHLEHAMHAAIAIAQRYHGRGGVLPDKEHGDESERQDVLKLMEWGLGTVGGSLSSHPCPSEVLLFLDKEMPHWRDATSIDLDGSPLPSSLSSSSTPSMMSKNLATSAMQRAEGIVQRFRERGNVLPRDLRGGNHGDEITRKQESRDSAKLNYWKLALKSPQSRHKCPEAVKNYLDAQMPGWTDKVRSLNKQPMDFAMEIVARYIARGNVLPRELKNRNGDPEREEEYRDATKLRNWKKALRGSGTHMCSAELTLFLDTHMSGWRKPKADKIHLPLHFARDIVARVQQRQGVLPRELKDTRNDPVRIQEYKDACKLNNWKKSLRGIGTHRCPEHIQALLDEHLPTWRNRGTGGSSAGGRGKKRSRDMDMEESGGDRRRKEGNEEDRDMAGGVILRQEEQEQGHLLLGGTETLQRVGVGVGLGSDEMDRASERERARHSGLLEQELSKMEAAAARELSMQQSMLMQTQPDLNMQTTLQGSMQRDDLQDNMEDSLGNNMQDNMHERMHERMHESMQCDSGSDEDMAESGRRNRREQEEAEELDAEVVKVLTAQI